MTEYNLHTQDDYDRLNHSGVTFADEVDIRGDVTLDERAERWDIYAMAGRLTVPSSVDTWVTLDGGDLTVTWDEGDCVTLSNPTGRAVNVTMAGDWPTDQRREDDPFRRIYYIYDDAPTATITYEDGRTETEEIIGTVQFSPVDEVASPTHYTWIGQAIVSSGGPERTEDIESWDILDALFPDDPHLWNAGKYLTRLGRKGPGVRRIVDLRKARTYLDRAIRREERDA